MSGSAAALPAAIAGHPDRPHRPHRWTIWTVAAVGLVLVVASLVLAFTSDHLVRPGLSAFLMNWILVPYLVSGLVAWWRRPASRLGPLMLVTGLVMAQAPMQWSNQPVLFSIGHLLDMVPAALFLHVFLAFPTGRLERRPERILVGTCYATVISFQVVKVLLGNSPTNVFVVVQQPAAAALLEGIQLVLVSAELLAGGVLLILRRRARGRPVRRPAAWLVDAFGLALVMLALLYLAGMNGWPQFEIIRHVTFGALGLAPVAFLVALLDARLARADAAELLVELRADPTIDLQAPLARALGDPTLRLAYWLPQFDGWADQDGEPTEPPRSDERQTVRLIYRDHEPMAALIFQRALEDEPELVDAVAAAAEIALENGRLRADLRAQLQELQSSRVRVLEAGRKERQRLERNLHDGAQQRLVALSLELGMLGTTPGADAATQLRLARAKREVSASLEELRDLARGIYPAVLSGHGLAVALESVTAWSSVPVELRVELSERPPESVEVAVYYVVSESLANIAKHARAGAASVLVRVAGDRLTVEVRDDGVGGADAAAGSGLRGLDDRVAALGGRLRVGTPATGGTLVEAEIPWR